MAGRMGARLMAVVAEGARGRIYLDPTDEMAAVASSAAPNWRPEQALPNDPRAIWCPLYGLTTFADLFTDRQLVALTTFSDLVTEAREAVLADALAAGMDEAAPRLAEGGAGAHAYADAVATCLGLGIGRASDYWSANATWHNSGEFIRNTFARQAIPMVWDFAEANPFSTASGNWTDTAIGWIGRALEASPDAACSGTATQSDAGSDPGHDGAIFATDPPYYDNIGYADLSDFFYVWLRRTLRPVHPDLFRTLATPKANELVATPYRFGGDRGEARRFFETGLGRALARMRVAQAPDYPMTLFYAYKQAESASDGEGAAASTGWETMLSGLVAGGFAITGTWPVRSELGNRTNAMGANALASSIVLACRARPDDAPIAARREFASALRRELPEAIRRLQAEDIAAVDLAQAAIGPGMAVFSRYAGVLEADGTKMGVRQALVEINRVLDETLAEAEGDLDADTRFCVAWYEQYGMEERAYGEAEVLFTAKNTSYDGLAKAGVIVGGGGRIRLKRRDELDPLWDPAKDPRIADWECVQHLVRALTDAKGGGVMEAASLVVAMGPDRADRALALAYRLYRAAERQGAAAEARDYNILVTSWPQIRNATARLNSGQGTQGQLGLS